MSSSKTSFGRKHSQYIYLTKDFYEKYINNFYKATIKKIIIKYLRMANKYIKRKTISLLIGKFKLNHREYQKTPTNDKIKKIGNNQVLMRT